LNRDLSLAMYRCEHPLLKTLFPEGAWHTLKNISYVVIWMDNCEFNVFIQEMEGNIINKLCCVLYFL
jgi:hypothetical protein